MDKFFIGLISRVMPILAILLAMVYAISRKEDKLAIRMIKMRFETDEVKYLGLLGKTWIRSYLFQRVGLFRCKKSDEDFWVMMTMPNIRYSFFPRRRKPYGEEIIKIDKAIVRKIMDRLKII